MDRSFGSSSMIRAVPSNETAATFSCNEEEESGWTKYFEDFSNNNRQEQASFCSSLVSDASSGAAWRVSHNNSVPKKLKKTRTKKIGDHDLEDTASSPVNSPKIGDFRPVDHMNPRKIEDHRININSLGKEHFAEMKQADENSSDCSGKNGQNTDLKKKGLCLVPLNLLVNYLV
ncbi:PREDICTED: uncharacterized protein LOC101296524 [Fragaria vesca subsp. vesca]|uniref:uncharacterized protein LOC101296524 n=1 Tax=Fragaria vesca subsp. vesca TaxID=101020 RepID=UPI0002C36D77|nr:PREDICTED: uncharacterized protein LOC101296524 [Fragaria vesca subsp. vesca]